MAQKKIPASIFIVLLLVVLAIVTYWTYQSGTIDLSFINGAKMRATPSPSPTPTPTPIQLMKGKETYTVSQGAHKGPSISQVVFDPLDVRKGKTLSLEVTVTDTTDVTEVTGTLQTDGGTQGFSLTKSGQQDVWTGTVVPDNTLWYTYILTITAKSANGTSLATVAPRS